MPFADLGCALRELALFLDFGRPMIDGSDETELQLYPAITAFGAIDYRNSLLIAYMASLTERFREGPFLFTSVCPTPDAGEILPILPVCQQEEKLFVYGH